ncbi:MAG TPA: MBL fold metallo-hydrolase [Gemmatimonadales bacterium]|jgi:L-ascorbate metabolism protein UlaG (beta-lactamase superfamily)
MTPARAPLRLTYIGGPTVLIEVAGLRLLTDPTFDPVGAEIRSGTYVLEKTEGPAIPAADLGHIDAVLLSHDHHFDNLDRAGREVLGSADRVLTTAAAVERLNGRSEALAPWQSVELRGAGGPVRVTGTPARHGPAHMDRGPVIGFALEAQGDPRAMYVSGDTVWYEGIAEVASRFSVGVAVLFMGAARVDAVGPWNLTMTAEEAVEAAHALEGARIVPLHYAGWKHFSESRADIDRAFRAAGLGDRLVWLPPGQPTEVAPHP